MVDVQGIQKTVIYQTCFLRRNIVRLIQNEIGKPDYDPKSRDLNNLNALLIILNRELRLIGVIK